jgi:hypothetical protein
MHKIKHQTVKYVALAARTNAAFLVTLSAYALLTLVASSQLQIPIYVKLYYGQSFWLFVVAVAVITGSLLLYLIARIIVIDRPDRPFDYLWTKFFFDWKMLDRLFISIPAALAMPIFFSFFTSVKLSINKIIPFYADPFLANADRIVMGNDAWLVLQPIAGLPVITFALDFIYNLWFIVMLATLFCVITSVSDFRLRSQYLVAYVLVLAILGNALAVLFSSVGPCFYEDFYGLPRYADLIAYLHSANRDFPIWALDTQLYLMKAKNGPHFGAGISAFPSIHVAVVMLNVMFCQHLQRPWRIASIVFLIFILIGSVQLGWHYAIDGYFSILAVPIIWWVAGKISLPNTQP